MFFPSCALMLCYCVCTHLRLLCFSDNRPFYSNERWPSVMRHTVRRWATLCSWSCPIPMTSSESPCLGLWGLQLILPSYVASLPVQGSLSPRRASPRHCPACRQCVPRKGSRKMEVLKIWGAFTPATWNIRVLPLSADGTREPQLLPPQVFK